MSLVSEVVRTTERCNCDSNSTGVPFNTACKPVRTNHFWLKLTVVKLGVDPVFLISPGSGVPAGRPTLGMRRQDSCAGVLHPAPGGESLGPLLPL